MWKREQKKYRRVRALRILDAIQAYEVLKKNADNLVSLLIII